MIARALSTRLLVTLIAAQIGAIMLAMAIFPFVAPFVTFNDIADATFRSKIERALTRTADGGLAVQPTADLARYRATRPTATFAALSLDSLRIAGGSDPALARRLIQIHELAPRPGGNLITRLPRTGTLVITTRTTHGANVLIATANNRFRLEDWPSLVALFAPVVLPIYGPVIFGALVLIPLIVALVTRPLRRLAAQAARITPGALQHRLTETGLGQELQLLARAVNEALGRIEQRVARQILYAANAAHELRTPIAILGLHIDQLENSALKTALQSDKFRIQTLVEQLVTVARLGQHHVAMDDPIDLVALLRDVVADRAPIAIKERRALDFATEIPALEIRGNREALSSALANIVDNAIRAEPPGGAVCVRVHAGGEVQISDHGCGIPAADRAKIFEPFWRGTTAPGGAGLGLAIVKEIADRHRVGLAVTETAGGGATFTLRFRLVPRTAATRQTGAMFVD